MNDFFSALQPDREKSQIVKSISEMPSNYVGSKRRLLAHIWDILENNNVKFNSVFDAFSGSAMVSMLFKKMGKEVFCNDLLTSSAISAVCLLENSELPITQDELNFLCLNKPTDTRTFVLDNYKDKFFTERECNFLDQYRRNVEIIYGSKFYCGLQFDKRSEYLWRERWEIPSGIKVSNDNSHSKNIERLKYKSAFSLFAIENHINQNCFLGGRYYNGQTVSKLEHRLKHQKSKGKEICDIPLSVRSSLSGGSATVFNSDTVELLESKVINADLVYLDPPYGGASSDYAVLYRFLEEYLYEDKLENLEHIQKGSKRFSHKKGYQEQFENLLSLCQNFETWLISYNESSYANLETIKDTIKNAGRKDITVQEIPITYQYRKGKSDIDLETIQNYFDDGHKYTQRGTEYLIMAR